MKLGDVMDELAEALDTIEGLSSYPYYAQRVSPPAVSVGWPDEYKFDRTFGRGLDSMTVPVVVVVGKVDARSAKDKLSQYADGSGDMSVKSAIESHDASSWHDAQVVEAEFDVVSISDIDYLAAEFKVKIYGKGA